MVIFAGENAAMEMEEWTLSADVSDLDISPDSDPTAQFVAMLRAEFRNLLVGDVVVHRRDEGYAAVHATFRREEDCLRVLDRIGIYSSELQARSGELVVLSPWVAAE